MEIELPYLSQVKTKTRTGSEKNHIVLNKKIMNIKGEFDDRFYYGKVQNDSMNPENFKEILTEYLICSAHGKVSYDTKTTVGCLINKLNFGDNMEKSDFLHRFLKFFIPNSLETYNDIYLDEKQISKKEIIEDNPEKYWNLYEQKFSYLVVSDNQLYFPIFTEVNIPVNKLCLDDTDIQKYAKSSAFDIFRKNHFLKTFLFRISHKGISGLPVSVFEVVPKIMKLYDFKHLDYTRGSFYEEFFRYFMEDERQNELIQEVLNIPNIESHLFILNSNCKQTVKEVREDLEKMKNFIDLENKKKFTV